FVPPGTELNSVTVSGGVATVDLSEEFAPDEPGAARRVAQVVFTLTRLPSIDAVLFRENGAATQVRTDNGARVSRPVSRADYLDYQAAISDRKSTRLNSSHVKISYAVVCLKKKK